MTFCQFQGGNIITTYEAINNTRGYLAVNSQSTQRQSLSNRERLLGTSGLAGGGAKWCASISTVCGCACMCVCLRVDGLSRDKVYPTW